MKEMKIDEAVSKAMEKGKYIYRESENDCSDHVNILPTNTYDCCLLLQENSNYVGKRWNPTANDLMASDWEIR
ncbi:Thoeris anti-defense Tad2 family protein [Enterococcus faecalis]|uniref:Thoeris anti-defense Tad2 family protein n=1 Tax=Enterococcus faecalis TaxID=1351 RepID=UPI00338DD9FD|nr:DUF2829 domain-containing protein [Enterococcus faecalis]